MTATLETVHHPKWTERIAFVAWLALLGVEFAVHGVDLFIMGSDAGLLGGFAFAAVALVMLTVKALAWSSDWNELGGLFAVIGVCLMILFASAIYDLATPLPSEVKHSEAYLTVAKQLETNNTQLQLQDLSKESRLALLQSNTGLTAQLTALNQADLDALKPRLTLRSMFESIASMPAAPLAKWLCVIFFGLIGFGLEVANYRITPRRAGLAVPTPIPERIDTLKQNWGQTPLPTTNEHTERKEHIDEHRQTEARQLESEVGGQEVYMETVAEARNPAVPARSAASDARATAEPGPADRVEQAAESQAEGAEALSGAIDVLAGSRVSENAASVAPYFPGNSGSAFSFPLTGDQLRRFAHMMLRRYPVVRSIDETLEKNPHVPRDVLVALYQRLTGLESGQAKYFRWDGEQGLHVGNYERRILDRKLESIE